MATTATNETAPRCRAWYAPGLLALATGLASGAVPGMANAEFEVQVTLGASHTDNLSLAPVDETSELVYRLEPSFHYSHESPRLNVNADYQLQAFRYRDLGENDVYHQYDASLRAALIPDNFFFEVGGIGTQSIIDPETSIPQGNLGISPNRQDRDEYYATPSFQFALGSSVLTEAMYRHSWVNYDDRDVPGSSTPGISTQGNEQREAEFTIDNYRAGHGLTWAMRYNWQKTEYDEEFLPWEYQQAIAELGFWAGTNTRLFAAGGLESAWDDPFDPSLEDELWEVGFARQIGERLSAEFAVGERTFGSSWRGSLDFQFSRGSTKLSYSDTPTTQGRNPYRNSDFDEEAPPDDLLNRPGNSERYIDKRFEWRLNLDFQRSDFSIMLFDSDRTDRTSADGTPQNDESQRGATANVSYRLGARTDLRLSGYYNEREFREGDTSELMRASAALEYRFGSRTSLSLEYEYAKEDGESPVNERDYVANVVSLLATRTF